MYIKKNFYYRIERLAKKFIKLYKKNSKNKDLVNSIQKAIYETSDKEKILFLNKNKQKYLVHTNDIVSKEMFINYQFDFKKLKKAVKLLGKNHKRETLLNIGGMIGSICIKSVKENFFKSAIVFEPAKINFRLLMANIFINELEDKIKAYQLALSSKKTLSKLVFNKGNFGDTRFLIKNNNQKNSEFEKVKSDKLDNFTSKLNKKNTLIFMDVEGHEPYVLKGGRKTIKKQIPIVLEFSPYLFDKNWIANFDLLFKNYKYFYNLHNNKRKKLNKENFYELFKEIKSKKIINPDLSSYATDLMIV